MKRILALIILFCAIVCHAQTLDDIGKIIIGVDIPETSSPATLELKDHLYNKVSHWISQAGYSANGITSFYLYPEISIDSEDLAEGGMKNVYVISGTLYLKITQGDGNIVFSSISLPFRDSATKRSTALKNGINKIQYQKMLPLLDQAKDRILKYYESEKENIFAHADMMAKNKDYNGAIACLMSIPSCLTSIYNEALIKADDVLDRKTKVYNDSILVVAQSYLAEHDAHSALDVLSLYQDAKEVQNAEYNKLLKKAEGLVTAAEIEAAREKRQQYLDQKEREKHLWEVEAEERAHRIDMDNQKMAYNREALASNERLTAQRIVSEERITNQKIAAGERLASQSIAANERLSTQRINALKSIAADYYRNNRTRTVLIKYQ